MNSILGGLGLWVVPLMVPSYGQDSSGLGQTVRIVRAYDPHLPEWFRLASDPVLMVEPTTRIALLYKSDSLSFVQPFGPLPKYNEPSLATLSFQPQSFSRASVIAGGMPGMLGHLGAEWSGPLKVASQTLFAKIDFRGASGNSNGWWGDLTQRVMIWNPQLNVEWQPVRNREWRVGLFASQRSSRFTLSRQLSPTDTTPPTDSSWVHPWNNLRFNPRISWNRVSQQIDGLHQKLVLEGFGIMNWNSSDQKSNVQTLGNEWSSLMTYQIGYREDHTEWGMNLGWSGSSVLTGTAGTMNMHRNTFSIKPSWAGDWRNYRIIASVNFLRQSEQEDSSISTQSFWNILPELVLQYRQPGSSDSSLKGPWMVELGVTSGIFQPSVHHWTSIYPTLSTIDAYQASVQRAEGFVRFEHWGGEGLRWQHRFGLGSWTNARFFGLDTNTALGVMALRLPHVTRLSLETKVNLREQSQIQAWFSVGMQGIISQSSWMGMPGLQPVFWGNLHFSRTLSKVWKIDLEPTIYAVDSKRLVSKNLSTKNASLDWPLNLDLRVTRSFSSKSGIALNFRQRQATPWLLWADDVLWGRSLHVEWRWKF